MSPLDNEYECAFFWRGNEYRSAGYAILAARVLHPVHRYKIMNAKDIYEAYALSAQSPIRPDWDERKDEIITDILRAKYFYNEKLGDALVQEQGKLSPHLERVREELIALRLMGEA